MAILVIAEHDHVSLKPSTLNAVTAAAEIGGDIHVLVAGSGGARRCRGGGCRFWCLQGATGRCATLRALDG